MIQFYNAGAGSGKTYQLTNDLVRFLTEGNGTPAQVILTTFTIKAAEELKERVRNKLLESGEAAKAAEMSNALIGTVNSICSRLVETYALEAGLTPGLRILDENAVNVFFEEFIAFALPDESYDQFSVLSGRLSMFEDTAYRTKDFMKPTWPGVVKALAEKFRSYGLLDKEQVIHSMNKSLELIENLLPTSTKKKANLVKRAKACMPALAGAREKTPKTKLNDIEFILSSFLSHEDENDFRWNDWLRIGKMNFSAKLTREFPELSELVDIMQQFHQLPEFKADWIAMTKLLYETAFSLLESYQQYKQERGLIDFADQEYLLLRLLNEHQLVREEIKSGYKMIMVDELQDSSPLQIAIFSKLQEIIDTSIWVGDPKQSIYGFRGADAELFMNTMREVERNYQINELGISRRSRPELVQVVNAIFTGLFRNMLPEKRIRLEPWADIATREKLYSSPALHIYFFDSKKVDDYFTSLALKIKQILHADVNVYDKEAKIFRKITAGDIGVLFRSNTDVDKMGAALTSLNIPVAVETSGFEKKAEVNWMCNLLRLLINPNDSMAIANLMLLENAVDGVEQLIEKRLHHLEQQHTMQEWQALSPTARRISEGRQLVDHMPLLQTLEYLIAISDLPVYCARWGDYGVRMATLNHLLLLAGEYEAASATLGVAASFAGFLNYVESNTAIPPGQNKDAVNVMTVHASKGLEWPMVIPAKMNLDSNDCRTSFNQVHVQQTGEFELSNPLKERQLIYLAWPFGSVKNIPDQLTARYGNVVAELNAEEKFLQEEDRLLYVALTRARDYLVLTGDEKCASYASLFEGRRNVQTGLFNETEWNALRSKVKPGESKTIEWNNFHIRLEKPVADANQQMTATSLEQVRTVDYYDLGTLSPKGLHKNRRVSPSTLQHEKEARAGDVNISVIGYNGKQLAVGVNEQLSYEAVGTIIHTAFASWNPDSSPSSRVEMLKQVIHNFNAENHIHAGDLEARFSDFWKYIESTYQPTRFWKEIPLQSVEENNGALTSGFADLVLDTSRGLVLIDHKTFPGHFDKQVMDKESAFYAGKYAGQLKTYAGLISITFGKEVTEMLLHYVTHGKLVKLST